MLTLCLPYVHLMWTLLFYCFLAFEIRPLPGMNLQKLQKDIEFEVSKTAEADKMDWKLEKLIVPPFCSDDHSEIVALCEKLTGHRGESVAFATEAPYLQELGMDVVVLGPGLRAVRRRMPSARAASLWARGWGAPRT